MASYEDIKKEVDALVDGLGLPVDEGIKKAVIALRLAGVHTQASCEGHIDEGLPYPWILIEATERRISRTEANQLEREKVSNLLDDFYRNHTSSSPLIIQDQGIFGAFRIQSVYRHQKQEVLLEDLNYYRDEMDAFADFILNRDTSSH